MTFHQSGVATNRWFTITCTLYAAPDELAPPTFVRSPTSILLTWLPPEVPNGFILGYNVFRDGVLAATVMALNFTSEGLQPDSAYSFFIEAFNSVGSTRSTVATTRTLEGVPSGVATPNLTAISADIVSATWSPPTTPNGVIIRYELVMVTSDLNSTVFSGNTLGTNVPDLLPYTTYNFLLRACTVTGCGISMPTDVRTLEAPPTFQMSPNVSTLAAESLLVEWEEPDQPNGEVVRYEVRQRSSPFLGNGVSLGSVGSDVLNFTATDLRPFMGYEFSVVSYTRGGGTQSGWSRGITAEASKPTL